MDHSIYSRIVLCESLCFTEGKTRPSNKSDVSKFLSNLALLLNGNDTCTAVYIHQAEKTVLIARNQTIAPIDERYFNRFFFLIRIYASICFDNDKSSAKRDVDNALEATVLEYNSKKIIKRLSDNQNLVIDKLREMLNFDVDQRKTFIDQVRSNFNGSFRTCPLTSDKCYFVKNNGDEDGYFQWIFEKLNKFLVARDELLQNSTNPTDEQISSTVTRAVFLYQSRLFRNMLQQHFLTPDRVEQYFEKISAHGRSLNHILKRLLIQKDRYWDMYKNITWKLIPSISTTHRLTITPRKALENIITNMIQSQTDEQISNLLKTIPIDDYYADNPIQIRTLENDPNHDVHVHAEIVLIDYLLLNNINETNNSKEVEIGISKMSCLLCSYYIDQLNIKYNRCFCPIDSIHGKIYSKWDYRENEDSSILHLINAKLVEKIKKSVMNFCLDRNRFGPKRSDDGDSDIMSTSMEEEEYDMEYCKRKNWI